jgi:two-component system, NarL family, sensor kinase
MATEAASVPGPSRTARSGRGPLALASAVVVAVVATDLAGLVGGGSPENGSLWPWFLILCETVIAAVVGWLVVRRHPRHVVGWLLLGHGLSVAVVLSGDDRGVPADGSVDALLSQLGQGSWALLYLCLALIGYVFPDGRFLSRHWRRFVWGWLAANAVFIVAAAFDGASFESDHPGLHAQLPQPSPLLVQIAGFAGLVGIAAGLVGAVVSARARLRRANADERVQLLWFVWAAASIPGGLALCFLDGALTGRAGGVLTFLGVTIIGSLLPLAIGVAILRARLFDIELVLSRTLTYGALTALVVATYAAAVLGLRSLLPGGGAGLVAVGVVAVAIQPVHARLRRRVERWVYGDRSDPSAALRRLSDRLEETLDPNQVVKTVTRSVAEALRVDSAAVELDRDDRTTVAAQGSRAKLVRVPLVYQGERFGALVVEVPSGRQLSTADRRLLDDLARHAAVVVNAVRLTLALQRSRARLVGAQEEERRRLRRDLHDGLGPSLAAIVLKLNAISGHVDDPVAQDLLGRVREETRGAIAEIRRLVDNLRPPALDEVGLVAALRQKAASMSSRGRDDGGLAVDVEGPDRTPPLPAAVEVAAFRIALEALANVVQHSGATHCLVTLEMNGALLLCVGDNGTRPWDSSRIGVGLTSMRERAEELGGSCTVTRRPEGGTLVRAVLPLPGWPLTEFADPASSGAAAGAEAAR